ncbi:MAG TPA: PA14 domain-containing protein [Verrucomicrobiales bacterium]|nr:PA14 domain-containing protein [Verrucomicrobiales bacterium]
MNPSFSPARFLLVFFIGFLSAAHAVVIDGSIAQDDYGDPLAIQTVNTGFGDNNSELNAAYGKIAGGILYLALTGNLEGNFNKLEIFIDAAPGGQNVIERASNLNNDNWAALFDGFRFDDGFAADYLLIFRHGNDGGQVLDLDFVTIGANEGGSIGRFHWQNPPSNGPFEASNGILAGFNNSNAAGVGGGESEADPELARAAQTGLELAIPLSLIGSPEGEIRICAMINGSNHDFLSNQFLGGLPAPQGNLGTDGQGSFVGGATLTVDLNAFAGEQFFVVPQDPGAAIPASVTRVEATVQSLTIEFTDSETSAVNPESIELRVDNALAPFLLEQDLPRTLVTYVPDPPFAAGSFHTYMITADDGNGLPIGRTGEFTLPESLLPTGNLPGPEGSAGEWGLRQIWDFGPLVDAGLDGLSEALAVANAADAPGFSGSISDAAVPYLNFQDGGIFFNSFRYPAQEDPVLGMPEDGYVIVAKGLLRIPSSGDWTLGVHSDDGFALRVVGAVFDAVHGGGQLDPIDRSVIGHPGNTADSDTRGILRGLTAGDYAVEIITWDAGGDDFFEFYAAPGAHSTDASTDQWALPGDVDGPAEVLAPGVSADGWTVKASVPRGDPIESLSVAEAVLTEVSESSEYDAVNFKDPDDGSSASGILPGDLPFPNDTPENDNHFAVEATALLVIPETAVYWIGFQSDDGAKLQIEGQNFEEIVADATGTAFGAGTGTLTCDCLTGNSRTLGQITLAEGVYPIRVVMFEAAFGSYLEVFGAEAGSPTLFPIARNGAGTRTVNRGLSLATPGGDIRIIDFQRAPSGGPAEIRWTSIPGRIYEVQVSSEARPDTWSALVSGYPEDGATETETSYTDSDPEGAIRFYRVALLPPAPVFTEDFESGAEGWLAGARPEDGGTTVWELGVPGSGPGAAHSGMNVYGTNLDGPYGNLSRIFLRSPLIDLRDRARATLEFWHFLEADAPEGGQVNLLAEDGRVLRAQLLIFTGESSTAGWRKAVLRLPGEALGQAVRIEFEFLSDDAEPNGDGWYLDDVLVTE